MDRFHRWLTKLNGKSHLSAVMQFDDLPIPQGNVTCEQCPNVAVFIRGEISHEVYLCQKCGDKYKVETTVNSRHWYCLTFQEVKELDAIEDGNLVPYTPEEAISIYKMNKDIYTAEEQKSKEPRVWFVLIDARVSRAFFRTFSIAEYLGDHSFPKEKDVNEAHIQEKWNSGFCLTIFADHRDKIIYSVFIKRPSLI